MRQFRFSSRLVKARSRPSGEIGTDLAPSCPLRPNRSAPVPRSKTCTLLSFDAVASDLPSGENATPTTSPSCGKMVLSNCTPRDGGGETGCSVFGCGCGGTAATAIGLLTGDGEAALGGTASRLLHP